MPLFKLNRNYVLRSKYGHMIDFVKGEPTHVPPALVKEAVSIGAECIDGAVDILGEEAQPAQPTQEELHVLMRAAFDDLVQRNDPDDFTAQGVPKVSVVETKIALKVSKSELMSAWQAYRTGEIEE